MKVIIVGASGKIGSRVAERLSGKHEVIRVGSRSGDIVCDYTSEPSVAALFEQAGAVDALIVAVGGDSKFKPYPELTDEDYRFGCERKLVAQARLVRFGERFLNANGSITLTSGFLSHYPNPHSIGTGPFNAAINAFVQHTAPLLSKGIRLNVVSPAPVVEPDQVGKGLVTADQVAEFYVEAVEGSARGEVFRAWGGLPIPE